MVMGMIIYYMNVEELPEDTGLLLELLEEGLPAVKQTLRQRIGQYKRREDQKRSLGAYLLLLHACRESGRNTKKFCIRKNPMGKPYFEMENTAGTAGEAVPFFNLSHSGAYAVCAYDEKTECGVDIQKIREDRMGIAERFFSESEKGLLRQKIDGGTDPARAFTQLWSRKESLAKCIGCGLQGAAGALDTAVSAYRTEEIIFTEDSEYVLTCCDKAPELSGGTVCRKLQKVCYNSQNGLHDFV